MADGWGVAHVDDGDDVGGGAGSWDTMDDVLPIDMTLMPRDHANDDADIEQSRTSFDATPTVDRMSSHDTVVPPAGSGDNDMGDDLVPQDAESSSAPAATGAPSPSADHPPQPSDDTEVTEEQRGAAPGNASSNVDKGTATVNDGTSADDDVKAPS